MEAQANPDFYLNRNLGIRKVVITDDFYRHPDKVREAALKMTYDRSDDQFPGLRSTEPFLTYGLQDFFTKKCGINWNKTIEAGTSNGCFQIMLESDGPNSYVHPDKATEIAALVYLSPGHDGEPGTSFYRHKRFGISEFPDTQAALTIAQEHGVSVEDFFKEIRADRFDLDRWECLYTLPYRYNRLVVYRSNLFHKNASVWGSDEKSGRLIHSFFLKE